MAKHNAANERIKRDYLRYLAEARGRDEATIDRVAKSLARFEASTGRRDFKRFHREQAMAFKRRLGDAINVRSGEQLSKATVHSTLRDLKAFFEWLSREPGFRSQIAYSDADYFNLSEKDVAIARARREKPVPTLEQVRHVLAAMPAATRAGASRPGADRLRRRRPARGSTRSRPSGSGMSIWRAALSSRTPAPCGPSSPRRSAPTSCPWSRARRRSWRTGSRELREVHLWGPADPLFPATAMGLDEAGGFQPQGLARQGWASTGPIRDIFRRAFAAAGLPYFNPHSFRDMLVRHAMTLDLTPEEMKAWSQNLGHADVLTTFTSYGTVPVQRQGELIRGGGTGRSIPEMMETDQLLATLGARLRR